MTRKEKLHQRAFKYAGARWIYDGDTPRRELSAYGYLEGYRAAMRDMRKALYLSQGRPCKLQKAVDQFLRPIR